MTLNYMSKIDSPITAAFVNSNKLRPNDNSDNNHADIIFVLRLYCLGTLGHESAVLPVVWHFSFPKARIIKQSLI